MTPALADRLDATLLAASRTESKVATITLPAPLVPPSHVFGRCDEPVAYYFASGDRAGDVGYGVACVLESSNLSEVSGFEAASLELLEQVFTIGLDAAAHAPRFYGGLAYDRAPNPRGPWRDFRRAQFHLPRFRYRTDGERATLTLCLRRDDLAMPGGVLHWREQVERALSRLCRSELQKPMARIVKRTESPNSDAFRGSVEAATRLIRQGELEKVVLAREVALELDRSPDLGQLLERIDRLSPETTRFAFRRGESVFFGATPERLVMRLGSEVRTEAVAGSIRALDSDAANRLLQSEKELHEHALVVRELVRKLEQLGARPNLPSRPSIRQLRHVFHLATSITARIFGAPHVLALVRHLHPTPAVGGVPEQAAAEFNRRHEKFERGWYAAPVGWFDGSGDGEFVVGLRSGLLQGNVLRLYAGAGIVRDSVPEAEYRETELKLQTLLDAFGAPNGTFGPEVRDAQRDGEPVGAH